VEDEFGFFCCEKENIHHLFLIVVWPLMFVTWSLRSWVWMLEPILSRLFSYGLVKNVMEVLIHPSYGPVAATAQPSYWLQCPYAIVSCHSKMEDVHVRR
jgi:hypothetical protein